MTEQKTTKKWGVGTRPDTIYRSKDAQEHGAAHVIEADGFNLDEDHLQFRRGDEVVALFSRHTWQSVKLID